MPRDGALTLSDVLLASTQRRQPVHLRVSQPKQILTPKSCVRGIDVAAGRQGGWVS
jgi:hypothetical protein